MHPCLKTGKKVLFKYKYKVDYMPTNNEIDKKLENLEIVKAIENKDVPYVITQFKGLIDETDKEARADERKQAIVKASKKANKNAFTPKSKKKIIKLLKQPNTQITMTTA